MIKFITALICFSIYGTLVGCTDSDDLNYKWELTFEDNMVPAN